MRRCRRAGPLPGGSCSATSLACTTLTGRELDEQHRRGCVELDQRGTADGARPVDPRVVDRAAHHAPPGPPSPTDQWWQRIGKPAVLGVHHPADQRRRARRPGHELDHPGREVVHGTDDDDRTARDGGCDERGRAHLRGDPLDVVYTATSTRSVVLTPSPRPRLDRRGDRLDERVDVRAGGRAFLSRPARVALTAPQLVWPSTTSSGRPNSATPNWRVPRTASSSTWPAERTTNRSPSPTSKTSSGGTRESAQEKTARVRALAAPEEGAPGHGLVGVLGRVGDEPPVAVDEPPQRLVRAEPQAVVSIGHRPTLANGRAASAAFGPGGWVPRATEVVTPSAAVSAARRRPRRPPLRRLEACPRPPSPSASAWRASSRSTTTGNVRVRSTGGTPWWVWGRSCSPPSPSSSCAARGPRRASPRRAGCSGRPSAGGAGILVGGDAGR